MRAGTAAFGNHSVPIHTAAYPFLNRSASTDRLMDVDRLAAGSALAAAPSSPPGAGWVADPDAPSAGARLTRLMHLRHRGEETRCGALRAAWRRQPAPSGFIDRQGIDLIVSYRRHAELERHSGAATHHRPWFLWRLLIECGSRVSSAQGWRQVARFAAGRGGSRRARALSYLHKLAQSAKALIACAMS